MAAHDPSRTTDDDAHASGSSAGQKAPAPPGRRYVYAWALLLVLTAVSFGADQLHLGSISTGIALLVAVLKASIVFVVFMHLDREPFPIRFVAGLNVAWVLLLCLGIAADIGSMAHAN
jgi:caa(3)-type oxidase subunit IV